MVSPSAMPAGSSASPAGPSDTSRFSGLGIVPSIELAIACNRLKMSPLLEFFLPQTGALIACQHELTDERARESRQVRLQDGNQTRALAYSDHPFFLSSEGLVPLNSSERKSMKARAAVRVALPSGK